MAMPPVDEFAKAFTEPRSGAAAGCSIDAEARRLQQKYGLTMESARTAVEKNGWTARNLALLLRKNAELQRRIEKRQGGGDEPSFNETWVEGESGELEPNVMKIKITDGETQGLVSDESGRAVLRVNPGDPHGFFSHWRISEFADWFLMHEKMHGIQSYLYRLGTGQLIHSTRASGATGGFVEKGATDFNQLFDVPPFIALDVDARDGNPVLNRVFHATPLKELVVKLSRDIHCDAMTWKFGSALVPLTKAEKAAGLTRESKMLLQFLRGSAHNIPTSGSLSVEHLPYLARFKAVLDVSERLAQHMKPAERKALVDAYNDGVENEVMKIQGIPELQARADRVMKRLLGLNQKGRAPDQNVQWYNAYSKLAGDYMNHMLLSINDERHPPSLQKVFMLLGDEDPDVRANAVRVVGRVNRPEVYHEMVKVINDDPSDSVRGEAVGMLVNWRPPPVNVLIKALEMRDSSFCAACDALFRLHEDIFMENLSKSMHMDVRDEEKRMALVEEEILATGGHIPTLEVGPTIEPELVAALDDPRSGPSVRSSALETLGHFKCGGGETKAVRLLQAEADDHVRSAAAHYLGTLQTPKARQALMKVAEADDSEYVRSSAASALCNSVRQESEELQQEIDHEFGITSTLRLHTMWPMAVDALQKIGGPKAEEALARIPGDDPEIRAAAVKVLWMRDGRRKAEHVAYTRGNRFYLMVPFGPDDETIQKHAPALNSSDPREREVAIVSLAMCQSKLALPPLLDMIEKGVFDTDFGRTLMLIEPVADETAVEPLIRLLSHADDEVRRDAAEVLGRVGDKRACVPLTKLLTDKNEDIVETALYALGTAGDERAIEPLSALIEREEAGLYPMLRRAQAILGDKRIHSHLTALADAGRIKDRTFDMDSMRWGYYRLADAIDYPEEKRWWRLQPPEGNQGGGHEDQGIPF